VPVVAQFFTSALIAVEAFVAYSLIFRTTEPQSAESLGSTDEIVHS
jgi:hypothetical protein